MTTHDDIDPQAVMGAYFDALLHEPAAAPVTHAHVDAAAEPHGVDAAPATNDVVAAPALPVAPAGYQLVRIAGLTLGIPAQAIAAVLPAAVPRASATASRPWLSGSYQDERGEVTVVDTAAVLTPGMPRTADVPYAHLVVLKDYPWALACDSVEALLTPEPGSVHWRGAQGKRPWLAGTVSVPSCALLDIAGLITLLEG